MENLSVLEILLLAVLPFLIADGVWRPIAQRNVRLARYNHAVAQVLFVYLVCLMLACVIYIAKSLQWL